jgi:hypothetical protein
LFSISDGNSVNINTSVFANVISGYSDDGSSAVNVINAFLATEAYGVLMNASYTGSNTQTFGAFPSDDTFADNGDGVYVYA